MGDEILKLRQIGKQYNGHSVLRDVNISLCKGEILGLMGANGSGKSTLLNILSGDRVIQNTGGYEGSIEIGQQPVEIHSTVESQNLGICMVHQEFNLLEQLSAWENIALSVNTMRSYRDLRGSLKPFYTGENREMARKILQQLKVDVDPDTPVSELPVNIRQFVEIARIIVNEHTRLLMLDEPTATLNAADSAKLLQLLSELAAKGMTIILVSHRIEEIIRVSDKVLVLRDGDPVYLGQRSEQFNHRNIAKEIVGYHYHFQDRFQRKTKADTEWILRYNRFSVRREGEPLQEVTLDIRRGEIIGLTGMDGHGKSALSYGTMGFCACEGHFKYLPEGRELTIRTPAEAIREGIVFVTEERRKDGLLLEHSVTSNINFYLRNFTDYLNRFRLGSRVRFFDHKKERLSARKAIDDYGVVCKSMDQPVAELSGGNQQKISLAKAMLLKPKVLFINEPTRGIDIRSRENILHMLASLNTEAGTTILLSSGDLDELQKICDRICVFYEGRLNAILPYDADDERFARAFSGLREDPYETI